MDISTGAQAIVSKIDGILSSLNTLHAQAHGIRGVAQQIIAQTHEGASHSFSMEFTIFLLACFVGYYVVWRVTPALHSPLMAVTNAISSVIIIGALLILGSNANGWPLFFAFLAVVLAAINIFGGFIVTQRMLQMFKKKNKQTPQQ